MAITYLLGVFNDNFFKQVAIFLAFAASRSELQEPIIKYFSLPFILFSAYAGFFADKFPKRRIVIFAKYLELVAMVVGIIGIITVNFPLIIAMVFLMALQSTLFGPALNGAIPELYPVEHVPKANAVIKMVTTIAIIVGISTAGLVLDQNWFVTDIPFGHLFAGGIMLLVAVGGVMAAYGMRKSDMPRRDIDFPWAGPIESVRYLHGMGGDPPLLLAILSSTFFYFTSTAVLAFLNELCLKTLGFSNTATSVQIASLAIGVAIGAIIAAKLAEEIPWYKILPLASLGFALCLFLVSTVVYLPAAISFYTLFAFLIMTGICGGIFLIPVVTFIQVRPAADRKGRTIGVSNFLDFSGIFLAGAIFGLAIGMVGPVLGMAVTGAFALLVAGTFFVLSKKETFHG
ncbi:MAG: MFS transporter [Gammaproteobacteria bacterium]|nr:MFS transporter [Gammaproteobacteria bacterium]